MRDSEWAIIKKAIRKPEAFAPLYDKYFVEIVNVLLRRTGSKELARDLTQQTFLKAMQKLHTYKPEFPFSKWLVTIALNTCRNYYRDEQKVRYVSADEVQIGHVAEEVGTPQMSTQQLMQLVLQLPAKELELVELRYFEQLSFKEMATVLGKSEAALKMKLKRILNKLKSVA